MHVEEGLTQRRQDAKIGRELGEAICGITGNFASLRLERSGREILPVSSIPLVPEAMICSDQQSDVKLVTAYFTRSDEGYFEESSKVAFIAPREDSRSRKQRQVFSPRKTLSLEY